FLAVPDTPLLFFSALFFYCYKSFIQTISWKNAILLGLVTALMFYSKYHGFLIVFFTLLSNLKLLTCRQTWLAGFCVLFFYAPHLLWQWENNWVSFRYHLFESNVSDYKFLYTTDYILGQLLFAGPLAGLILLPAAFLYKTKTTTEKALKFTLAGVYIVFLLSSFRGKVEVNWTMPVLIPLIVLSHQFIAEKNLWQKPLRLIFILSLLLVVAGRIYLIADIGPDNVVKRRFHHNKEWAKTIAQKTGNYPVVFYNSYQRASLFWFYSGKPSHSHNAYWERRNNYNFWPTEDQLLGAPVYIADIYNISSFPDSIQTAKGWIGFKMDSSFSALGRITIIPTQTDFSNRNTEILFTRNMSRWYLSFLFSKPELKTELIVGFFNGKNLVKEIYTGIKAQDLFEVKNYTLTLNLADLPPGKYFLRFGFKSKDYPPTHNSEKIDLTIR
ncbi:MAG: hypothetical protein EPN92_09695, partial [Chitinophagaceae bacterium]